MPILVFLTIFPCKFQVLLSQSLYQPWLIRRIFFFNRINLSQPVSIIKGRLVLRMPNYKTLWPGCRSAQLRYGIYFQISEEAASEDALRFLLSVMFGSASWQLSAILVYNVNWHYKQAKLLNFSLSLSLWLLCLRRTLKHLFFSLISLVESVVMVF